MHIMCHILNYVSHYAAIPFDRLLFDDVVFIGTEVSLEDLVAL